ASLRGTRLKIRGRSRVELGDTAEWNSALSCKAAVANIGPWHDVLNAQEPPAPVESSLPSSHRARPCQSPIRSHPVIRVRSFRPVFGYAVSNRERSWRSTAPQRFP